MKRYIIILWLIILLLLLVLPNKEMVINWSLSLSDIKKIVFVAGLVNIVIILGGLGIFLISRNKNSNTY